MEIDPGKVPNMSHLLDYRFFWGSITIWGSQVLSVNPSILGDQQSRMAPPEAPGSITMSQPLHPSRMPKGSGKAAAEIEGWPGMEPGNPLSLINWCHFYLVLFD